MGFAFMLAISDQVILVVTLGTYKLIRNPYTDYGLQDYGLRLGYPDIRVSGYPDIRISGYPDFRISGYPDIRVSRYPDIRVSGYLNILPNGGIP